MSLPHDTIDRAFVCFQQTGDTEHLAVVFDAAAGHLLRLAGHMTSDPNEAEDLLQAAFLVAIEHRERYQRNKHVVPWLFGIMANQARTRRAYREGRETLDDPDATVDPRPSGSGPHKALEKKELSEAIVVAIGKMPEQYQHRPGSRFPQA